MLTDDQRRLLAADLPRDVVKTLPTSGAPAYVSSHYVIERLNEVFGFDGWEVAYGEPTVREGKRPLVYVRATLTAAGVTRSDIGVGLAATEAPDAFETAIKAAYTDGIKRCARTLGASFGLALYDKARATVGYSRACVDLLEDLATTTDLDAWSARVSRLKGQLQADELEVLQGRRVERRRALQAQASEPTTAPAAPAPVAVATVAPVLLADPLAPLQARIAECVSLDELVAVGRARGAEVPQARGAEVGEWLTRRAASLGAQPAAWKTRWEAARKIDGASAEAWALVATILGAFTTATTSEALAQVQKAHAKGYAQLCPQLKDIVAGAWRLRLGSLKADTSVAAALEEELGRADTADAFDVVFTKIGAAREARTITEEQFYALASRYDQQLHAWERGAAA